MLKNYTNNKITTMTLRILEEDKKNFDRLRGEKTQYDFLNDLLKMYEKNQKSFNGIRINENKSISILLKSDIKLLNLDERIDPKVYTLMGRIIFESDEILIKVDSSKLSKHIKHEPIDCIYKWSILYDNMNNQYLIYEEFIRANLDVRRCRTTESIKGIIPMIIDLASNNDINEFRYISADSISFDELSAYI